MATALAFLVIAQQEVQQVSLALAYCGACYLNVCSHHGDQQLLLLVHAFTFGTALHAAPCRMATGMQAGCDRCHVRSVCSPAPLLHALLSCPC